MPLRSIVLLSFCLLMILSCRTSDSLPIIIDVDPTTTVAPTLASIQPVTSDQAELLVKAGADFGLTTWRLTLFDTAGHALPLTLGVTSPLDLFSLTAYRVSGLRAGQTYTIRFDTRNAGGDSIHAQRTYRHTVTGPYWLRLRHAPAVGGNFAASALSTDNLPPADVPSLSVWRYVDEQSWQTMTYYSLTDSWYVYKTSDTPSPRLGVVRYRLQAVQGVVYEFDGLGYVTNESLPGQRIFLKDMGGVLPYYGGPDGVVRWFASLTRAYQLTEGGPPQLWIRQGSWDQYRGPDLPEPTGTLATFRVGGTGYVVNQQGGQPPHLWAFDMALGQWSRKADFPGILRSQGIGFSASEYGYFGLGINSSQETLRDIWQYEPSRDRWQYATEYPGAGSTGLVVGQLSAHTLLGLGYEHQPIAGTGIRLTGCTDFWEFKAN